MSRKKKCSETTRMLQRVNVLLEQSCTGIPSRDLHFIQYILPEEARFTTFYYLVLFIISCAVTQVNWENNPQIILYVPCQKDIMLFEIIFMSFEQTWKYVQYIIKNEGKYLNMSATCLLYLSTKETEL